MHTLLTEIISTIYILFSKEQAKGSHKKTTKFQTLSEKGGGGQHRSQTFYQKTSPPSARLAAMSDVQQ